MHQVQINIVQTQVLQGSLETLFDASVVRAPQLGSDEQILALDDTRINGLLDTLADLVLIAIAQSTVNVAVAHLNSVAHGTSNLARRGLPGTQA